MQGNKISKSCREITQIKTKTSSILITSYLVVGYPVLLDFLLHTREAIESFASKLEKFVSNFRKN